MTEPTPVAPLPADHDERLAAARREAGYEIGDPSWADVIIGAYWYPTTVPQDDER